MSCKYVIHTALYSDLWPVLCVGRRMCTRIVCKNEYVYLLLVLAIRYTRKYSDCYQRRRLLIIVCSVYDTYLCAAHTQTNRFSIWKSIVLLNFTILLYCVSDEGNWLTCVYCICDNNVVIKISIFHEAKHCSFLLHPIFLFYLANWKRIVCVDVESD